MSPRRTIAATIRILLGAVLLFASVVAAAHAQSAPQEKLIYAQELINRTLSLHPDVVVTASHVTPSHQSESVIIASDIGRIGKKEHEDDLRVIHTGKSSLEVNKTGDRFEDESPLVDRREDHGRGRDRLPLQARSRQAKARDRC